MTNDSLSHLTLSTYLQDELNRLIDITKKAIQLGSQNYKPLAETFYALHNIAKDILPNERKPNNFSELIANILSAINTYGIKQASSVYYTLLHYIQRLMDIGCSAVAKTDDESLIAQFEWSYDIFDQLFLREAYMQLKAFRCGISYAA